MDWKNGSPMWAGINTGRVSLWRQGWIDHAEEGLIYNRYMIFLMREGMNR